MLLRVTEAWQKLVSLPPGAALLLMPPPVHHHSDTHSSCLYMVRPLLGRADRQRISCLCVQVPSGVSAGACVHLGSSSALPIAVEKLLGSAQPSVEFTRKKYVEAHDAFVASLPPTPAPWRLLPMSSTRQALPSLGDIY